MKEGTCTENETGNAEQQPVTLISRDKLLVFT